MNENIYYLDKEYEWFGEFCLNIDNKNYIFSGVISYKPNELFYLELINNYEDFDKTENISKIQKINKIAGTVFLKTSGYKEYITIYCYYCTQQYDSNISLCDLNSLKIPSNYHPRLSKIFFGINIAYFHNNSCYDEETYGKNRNFFIYFNKNIERFFYGKSNIFGYLSKEINFYEQPLKLDDNYELLFLQQIVHNGPLKNVDNNNDLIKKYFLSNDKKLLNKINDEVNEIFKKNRVVLSELNREEIKIILKFIVKNKSIFECLECFYKFEQFFKILNNNFNIGINAINMFDNNYYGDFKILYLIPEYNINLQNHQIYSFEELNLFNNKIEYSQIVSNFNDILKNFYKNYESLRDIIFILNENHFYTRFTYLYLSRTIDCIEYITMIKNLSNTNKYKTIIEEYFGNNLNMMNKIKNILKPIDKKHNNNSTILAYDDFGTKISELRASIVHFDKDRGRKINITDLKTLNELFELLLRCFIYEEIKIQTSLIDDIKNNYDTICYFR